MRITHVEIANWRNFKMIDIPLGKRLFVVGPNASGKSNFLDVFRFLADIAKPGGGLADAVESRRGLSFVRSLFARRHRGGRVEITVTLRDESGGGQEDEWRYSLAIRGEAKGKNRIFVAKEEVVKNGVVVLSRPDADDQADDELLTQTHLEQIRANAKFRAIAEYFQKIHYFHLVPQVVRAAPSGSADSFGAGFIAQINSTPKKTREAWLRRITEALKSAVPEFETLEVTVDDTGRPHLSAGYRNWRASPTVHTEAEFSDGTLRLIGLLWTVVSSPKGGGLILLEEPELSLNASIVRMIPTMLATVLRDPGAQIFLTTHSPDILNDEGVNPDEVLVVQVGSDGSVGELLGSNSDPVVKAEIAAGVPLSAVAEPLLSTGDLRGLIGIGRR
ncbi:chromosome segregation protein SMC [Buchananella hordeovulneris]|uniref:Chromosome segregation protein SMC n=2 Tax=Buchananella hordeovulneris TaxID=52770 RepID=A0A1Q5PVQ3_9ACTO|nr:chromosome segregation protein SMC [Buchananella hordeovulneris]